MNADDGLGLDKNATGEAPGFVNMVVFGLKGSFIVMYMV